MASVYPQEITLRVVVEGIEEFRRTFAEAQEATQALAETIRQLRELQDAEPRAEGR